MNLLAAALSQSTKSAYSRVLTRFQTFATQQQLPSTIPISVGNLSLFITSLFNENLPAFSKASILSALVHHHNILGILDPTHSFAIQHMMIGIRKL